MSELLLVVLFGAAVGISMVEYSMWRYSRKTKKLVRDIARMIQSDEQVKRHLEEYASFFADKLIEKAVEKMRRYDGSRELALPKARPPSLKELIEGDG